MSINFFKKSIIKGKGIGGETQGEEIGEVVEEEKKKGGGWYNKEMFVKLPWFLAPGFLRNRVTKKIPKKKKYIYNKNKNN